MKFVYGDSERLFINPALGCKSRCSYCYLPSLGMTLGKGAKPTANFEQIIKEFADVAPSFIPGKLGTIISIGCYSECFDDENKRTTLLLIEHFLSYGNPIQVATKKYISAGSFHRIKKNIKWEGQLTIFISSVSILQWRKIEKGTSPPEERFKSFENIKINKIPTYLYIKPVIDKITYESVDSYVEVIELYKPSGVIVGSQFVPSSDVTRVEAPIGEGLLSYRQTGDERVISDKLSAYAVIYAKSTAAVNFWRNVLPKNLSLLEIAQIENSTAYSLFEFDNYVENFCSLLKMVGYDFVSIINNDDSVEISAGLIQSQLEKKLQLHISDSSFSGSASEEIKQTFSVLKVETKLPGDFYQYTQEYRERILEKLCNTYAIDISFYKMKLSRLRLI